MRLDMALTRSNLTCLLAQDGPMTRSEAGNADGFSYLPGRFFACAVRARGALYYSHDWVASVLSLAGVDAPAAGIAPNELGTVVSVEQPPANQR